MTRSTAMARPHRWLLLLAAGIVGLSCLLVYRHTADFGFVPLDDDVNIYFNPHLGKPTVERLRWMISNDWYVPRYIPLGWLGLSLVYSFSGLDPWGYHAVLIAFQAVNSVLVFVLLRRLLAYWSPEPAAAPAWSIVAALLPALWWALSPLRVESVCWSSGILYAQAIFFFLISVLLWVRPALGPDSGTAAPRPQMLLAGLAFSCSLLTYPIALGAAPVLVALAFLPARRGRPAAALGGRNAAGRRAAFEALPIVIAALGVLGATLLARFHGGAPTGLSSLGAFSVPQRLAQAAYVVVYYLVRPWWPFHLSAIYASLVAVEPTRGAFLASWLMLAGLGLALAVSPAFRRRAGPFLAAAFCVLLPVMGFTEHPHITYDRYAWLPALLWAVAAALLLARIRRAGWQGAVLVAALPLLVGSAVLSYLDSELWRNPRDFAERTAASLPPGAFPLLKYRRPAFVLLDYGQGAEAEAVLRTGRAAYPDDAFLRQTEADLLERREAYRQLSGDRPEIVPLAMNHVSRGLEFARAREWAEAAEHDRCALALSPTYFVAAYDRALALLALGRPQEALHDFLWGAAYARDQLPEANRRYFLEQLAGVAEAAGQARLAQAARSAAGSSSSVRR